MSKALLEDCLINLKTRQLLCVRDAARMLNCTPARVVQLANEGRIEAIVDSGGKRTFAIESVEKLARSRQRARTEAEK